MKDSQKVLRRRPRMTEEALKRLLQRHGREIVEDAENADNQRASGPPEAAGRVRAPRVPRKPKREG